MRKKNSEDDFQKGKQMSRELFQELRALLMERLDLARELSDEEILEEIDDLILGRMREYCLSLKEKV